MEEKIDKIAGRVILNESDDSQETVVTVQRSNGELGREITFSTDDKSGNYYLVVKKDDLLRVLEDKNISWKSSFILPNYSRLERRNEINN